MLRIRHATGTARLLLTGRQQTCGATCVMNGPTLVCTTPTTPTSTNERSNQRSYSVMSSSSSSFSRLNAGFSSSSTVLPISAISGAANNTLSLRKSDHIISTSRRGFAAAKFTMDQLKQLRARSGAPIVECKKALNESEGDIDGAMDWLRQHGAAKASSKVSGREASEGLVACKVDPSGKMASLVMVSSETDFAGRSPAFVDLISHVTDATLLASKVLSGSLHDKPDELMALEVDSRSIKTALEEAIVAIRENLGIKSAMCFQVDDDSNSVLVGYVHGRVDGSNAGSAAAIVEIAGGADTSIEVMQEAGKKLAMHVVAAKPEYLDPESVPADAIEKEKAILESQVCFVEYCSHRATLDFLSRLVHSRVLLVPLSVFDPSAAAHNNNKLNNRLLTQRSLLMLSKRL